MAAAMAMAASSNYPHPVKASKEELTDEDIKKAKHYRNLKDIERKKRQGLRKYNAFGVKVWALNKKNAERKALKIIKQQR